MEKVRRLRQKIQLRIKIKSFMNVFIVGLRRSGTTVLFDVFHEDHSFYSFYEPLNKSLKTVGGGSMNKSLDYNEKIRKFRDRYKEKSIKFHFGAPNDAQEEAGEYDISEIQKTYLRDMMDSHENTILKFVRATHIIKTLHELNPESHFIHIKKNPLRFAVSHLFGLRDKRLSKKSKVKRDIARYLGFYTNQFEDTDGDKFFSLKTGFDDWSQESIINEYIKRNERLKSFKNESAVIKLLLLWKEFNDKIERDGKEYFGEKFQVVNHENLCLDPLKEVKSIYSSLMLEAPQNVLTWTQNNVVKPRPIFLEDDPRWLEAIEKVGLPREYLNL